MISPDEFFKVIDNIKNQINTLTNEMYRIREQLRNLETSVNQMSQQLNNSRETTPTIESNVKWLMVQLNELSNEVGILDGTLKNFLQWKATKEGQLTVWLWLANSFGIGSIILHFLDKR